MSSPPTIAVAHYPEGAGHATLMLAIANALRKRSATARNWHRYRIGPAAMAAVTGVLAARWLRGTAVGLAIGCRNARARLRVAGGRRYGLLARGNAGSRCCESASARSGGT